MKARMKILAILFGGLVALAVAAGGTPTIVDPNGPTSGIGRPPFSGQPASGVGRTPWRAIVPGLGHDLP
jgi:hypothetical protein